MHRSRERAEGANGLQRTGIARAAGMHHDFAAELLAADPRDFRCRFGDRIIRDGEENDFRGNDLRRNVSKGPPGTDEFHRFARAGFRACGHNGDLPAVLMQRAGQGASHAPGAQNGEALLHPC